MTRLMRVGVTLTMLLGTIMATGSDALGSDRFGHHWRAPHFVPNSQRFWDNSKNWTTNDGPAYRDTVEAPENLVPCTGGYALCFHSGPEPLPCAIGRNGRFADCACTVEEGLNFVLISAILNYKVYLETIEVCGIDGSDCQVPDKAPVCEAIRRGKLIPPARLISTYDRDVQSSLATILAGEADAVPPPVTTCPKGPYAACMTAPCRKNRSGEATCSCPVFYGPYQLFGEDAQCDLGGRLVNSASYSVILAE